IHFTVVFSEAVTGFDNTDVTLGGTAGANSDTVTAVNSSTYDVSVGGMTGSGTVTASVVANAAHDAAGNLNPGSTSTDNTVTYDSTAPTVTINHASSLPTRRSSDLIHFTVVFSEAVTGFDNTDVTLGGTAGANSDTVTAVNSSTYD